MCFAEELDEARKASTKDSAAFVSFCRKHGMVPDTGRLKPWRLGCCVCDGFSAPHRKCARGSKWITPKQEKHRYDTSFFVLKVTAAEAATAAADKDEVTQHIWMTPREALDAQLARIIDLGLCCA